MIVAAIDCDGSGALRYLRPDLRVPREVQVVVPDWQPPAKLPNAYLSVDKITITVTGGVRNECDFEAAQNLRDVVSLITKRTVGLTDDQLLYAQEALERLTLRKDEDISSWARGLGSDLANHND